MIRNLKEIGNYLNGLGHDGTTPREMSKAETFYLNNKTLFVIVGGGIIIAGLGILAFLSSRGYIAASFISSEPLRYLGIAGIIAGSGISIPHFSMLILKKLSIGHKEEASVEPDVTNDQAVTTEEEIRDIGSLPAFKSRAAKLMKNSKFTPTPCKISKEQERLIKTLDVMHAFNVKNPGPDDFKPCYGMAAIAFFHKDLEDVVVKTIQGPPYLYTKKEIEEFQDINKNAIDICKKNNLYLLQIPEYKEIKKPGSDLYYLVQAKIKYNSDPKYQRGLFQWMMNDPELEGYAKELLKQLLTFICKTGFSDVKFNNHPMAYNGQMGLFDLDMGKNPISGLIRGCAGKRFGFFKIVPYKWFDEFVQLAQESLSTENKKRFLEALPELRQRMEKRNQKRNKILQFFEKKNITLVNQPIVHQKEVDEAGDINEMIDEINHSIAKSPDVELMTGRRLVVKFEKDKNDILSKLKEKGEIFSFKKSKHFNPHTYIIIC